MRMLGATATVCALVTLAFSTALAAEPCPNAVRLDVDGAGSDIDPGWTGMAHDNHYVGLTLTMGITGCAGATQPTCGNCSLTGPLANGGGALFNNRRCSDKSWITCTTNADCVAGGAVGPCQIFFGPPLPYTAGGVSVCVTNEITGPGSGITDVEAGSMTMSLPYLAKIYSGPTVSAPCPQCVAGVCNAGPRSGLPCTTNGTSPLFGPVSFDCPPSTGVFIGTVIPSGLTLSTNNQTMTLSAASPNCRAVGFTGDKCFCDTCNNAAATFCTSNADCVAVGATICGGKRCNGGTNNGAACSLTCAGGTNVGAPCVTSSQCPGSSCSSSSQCPGGGLCSVPGTAPAPNQCDDTVCTPNPLDTASSDEGTCAAGPFEQFCAIDTYRGCLTDGDCPALGDTCTFGKNRDCFTDNGVIGGDISVAGFADPPVDSTAAPTLGSLFCIPPTVSSAVNGVGGFPGPGRLTLPATSTLADESVSGTVGGGGTVTTDTEADGATPADPIETTVTSPNAGEIIINEQAATGTPPGGFTFLGKQVNITAPAASVATPLQLVFRIDASRIPAGEDETTITVFKNGSPVADCTAAGAVPDPCVGTRALLGDGDVELTIRTSTASLWNFGTGVATGPCDPTPDPTCRIPTVPQKALLLLKDKADDTKDKLVWKWLKGTTTYPELLGSPGTYHLCIYDAGGVVSYATVPSSPGWTGSNNGLKYKDKFGTYDGITQLQLRSHPDPGKAKVIVKGKGVNLRMPPNLGALASPVTVQLHREGDSLCWSATYSSPFIKQDSEQFKDKAD